MNSLSGQFGNVAVVIAFESPQSGPLPFVQPGALMSPLAFDQPPEYQAQSTPAALKRSPIVRLSTGGSRLASARAGGCGRGVGGGGVAPERPHHTPARGAGRPGPRGAGAGVWWSL